jgi:hypothetical protein
MKKLGLLLLLTLAGCAPFDDAQGDFAIDCVEFTSEVPLNMALADFFVSEAKRLFDGRFGEGEFCATLQKTVVHVRADSEWECLPNSMCAGFTNPSHQIELNRRGVGLLHEAIHVYELRRVMWFETHSHEFWDIKGYYALENEFLKQTMHLNWLVTP